MRILIADDHELFNGLIQRVFLSQGLAKSVVSCGNFDDAYATVGTRKAGEERFDLILLDMCMPGMNGLSGLRRMLAIAGGTPVAIISGTVTPAEGREVLREGAAGFLPKTMRLDQLVEAFSMLLKGERYVPPYLMVGKNADSIAARPPQANIRASLTSRERQVLDELKQGWSNKQIAQNLGITEITVKTHLMHLFRKMNARNRTDAVRIGMQSSGTPTEERSPRADPPSVAP